MSRWELRSLGLPVSVAVRDAVPCVVGAMLAGVLLLTSWAWPGDAVLHAVVLAVAGGLLYVAVLRLTRSGLTRPDAAAIIRALPRPARRPGPILLGLLTARPLEEPTQTLE